MIIRTKKGDLQAGNVSFLFDFLGIKKEEAGIKKVTQEVELIAPVALAMAAPFQLTENNNKKLCVNPLTE